MPDREEWMSLAEAYDYVLKIRRFPERAQHEILDKLRTNELGARAKSLKIGLQRKNMNETHDRPMSSYLFQAGHVDLQNSSLTKPQSAGSRNPWTAHAVEANNIEVLSEEVFRIRPRKQEVSIKKGGAPEQHDWAGAFAYCGWWVAKNGLPPQKQRLIELVTEWFETEDGGAPKDLKEIKLRTYRAYDELAKRVSD